MSNVRLKFSNSQIVDITECEWKDLLIVIRQMERDGTESMPEGFVEASYGCVHIGPAHDIGESVAPPPMRAALAEQLKKIVEYTSKRIKYEN